jgi:hypothetical protein
MSTKDNALIEKIAKAVHKRQLERTGAGRAFDETLPPTDGELDNARAALAVARQAILEEARESCEEIYLNGPNLESEGHLEAYDLGIRRCVFAIRSLATQGLRDD